MQIKLLSGKWWLNEPGNLRGFYQPAIEHFKMTDIALYVQIGITAICTIAYIWTYKYQSDKLKVLSNLIDSQSKIIADFEKYKEFFNIKDFEDRLKFKLDNQREQLSKNFAKVHEKIISDNREALIKKGTELMGGWDELAQIAISVAMKQFPKKEDKVERDKHLKKNYPKNAEYFISFCDAYLNEEIH